MYKTTDERGRERPIDYTVWSEVFTCPSCAGPIVFYEAAFNRRTGKVERHIPLPERAAASSPRAELERRKVDGANPGR